MQWYSLSTMIAIWLITITIELTSQSEILIIRHGRSRSRHSSEHARWNGLKAITDNLTITDTQKDALLAESLEGETNGDMNVVRFYEHNGTLTQSNEFNGTGASYEINYTFGPMPLLQAGSGGSSSSVENGKRHHHDWQRHQKHDREPSTTEMSPIKHSSSSTSSKSSQKQQQQKRRNSGRRKEFITDIKSTVDKGIQYLKAHENLDEVEIEINDYNSRRRNRNDETKRTVVKSNKIQSQSMTTTTTTGEKKTADQKDNPIHFMQQQQHKSHKQIKINGGDGIASQSLDSKNTNNNNNNSNSNKTNINQKQQQAASLNSFKLKKSTIEQQQQRHAAQKQQQQQHIKIHQAHNEIDMNINSNLADIFYVPTSKTVIEKAKQQNNPYEEDDDEQMLSDEPAGDVAIGNKMQIKETLMEKSNQHNQTGRDDANQNRREINSFTTVASPSHKSNSVGVGNSTSKRNATHGNGFSNKNKNSTMHTDKAIASAATAAAISTNKATVTIRDRNNNDMMIKDIEVSASMPQELTSDEHESSNIQLNDEMNNDEEFINSIGIQNDDVSNENENTIDLDSDFDEERGVNGGVLRDDDLDLSDLDETSRNNRKNLMRGRDVVTRFLQIVESQHMMGNNCTAGTALNLGEGVVDRYAQDRFRVEAEVAVNRANMLTRIFKMSPAAQRDINLLHASVLSMVEFDEDIFAAGHCFDDNQYPLKKGLFCPFAHRLPPPEIATYAKDLANEYHYLGNTSEWFFLARKNAEKVIARNEQYIKAYHSYSNDSERHAEEILSVKYEDGRWSKPYYDCGGGNIWMLTYTVPFFGYDNGTYFFKGTSGIDIDLRRVDIDQCPQRNTGAQQPLNIFAGTDKCKQRTTECLSISGLGFRRGSYKCICRKGFYYPDVKSEFKFFNGTHLEEEYAKWMQSEPSSYNELMSFECLPCAEGCDVCEDASPCVAELNWPMRTSILIMACAIIGFLPPAGFFTFRYQQVKIVKAASPALLRVIAMGAFLIYCTTIVMYPNPSLYTCVAKIWLREIGFSLTYGALMLKTWRISVIFRVRSAKAIKITDASLIKKLSLLCGFVSVFLLIRTLVSPPDVIVGRTADNLKAFLCKTDWWDHTFTSLEVLFLAWGVRLCIVVRKAPSEFNESRFISMAIYNEFLLTCFLNVSMLFLQSPANPDLLYIIFFCHTQLTVTLLLALIFGSKVYLVFRNGGKSLEDAMHSKSTTAKFISRSQPRTYASASSVNASTGQLQMNGADNRLSENEAVEEIKQLAKQLQNLYDRIPQKSTATNVILTLLDICRTVQNAGGGGSNQLLKPEQQPKAICGIANGSVKSASTLVDKETNTSRGNLATATAATCNCRSTISDKCDNDNHLNNSSRNNNNNNDSNSRTRRSKCCEANNQITCSTNSINFDNLQLQCMCSSDNNSLEDYPVDESHYCEVAGGSFRERLLNFTSANSGDQSLRKRNSELVLGTNFDDRAQQAAAGTAAASVYKNNQSYRISKTFDSCDNIFSQKPPPPTSLSDPHNRSNKSNHSLSTESDQKSIPYSFLERPSMKLSQSEDRNLRELKIALSSTLPSANSACNSNANGSTSNNKVQQPQQQVIGNTRSTQIISHSHSCTSTATTTSSNSSKIDKISFSLSTSSTSDALAKRQQQQQQRRQNSGGNMMTDETQQQQQQEEEVGSDNQNDNKSEDNKMITAASCDNKVASSTSNVNNNNNNNNSINSGNNNSGRRKGKGSESKLAIDLNDRSKYTEEVSV